MLLSTVSLVYKRIKEVKSSNINRTRQTNKLILIKSKKTKNNMLLDGQDT